MAEYRVAILGGNSHISKGLIDNFTKSNDVVLYIFSRHAGIMRDFLTTLGKVESDKLKIYDGYDNFTNQEYDLVINCVGVGTLYQHGGHYEKYFTVLEEYDNLVINYLLKNPQTLYVSFSSGVIYGNEFKNPAGGDSVNCLPVNNLGEKEAYMIARLNAEAKHRMFKNLNIIDLRVFAYFSRFIDLTDGYFITELINSIKEKKVFKVTPDDFLRDYLHPDDLYQVIQKLSKSNDVFDICSAAPVKKTEILEMCRDEFGLQYEMDESLDYKTATGIKNVYYSTWDRAKQLLGYKPQLTSLAGIKKELYLMLK